jgi:hypothetical protein
MNQQARRRAARHLKPLPAIVAACSLASLAHAGTTNVSVADASVAAGGEPAEMQFHLSRSGDLGYDALIRYHTADGTAVAGTDYVATSGVLTMSAGSNEATIPVTVNAVTGAIDDRTFELVLDGVLGAGPAPVFSAPVTIPSGSGARSAAIADVNGDGRPDVLHLNFSVDTMTVLLNETAPGATAAAYASPVTFATGDGPASLVVTDLNQDGRPDAVVTHIFNNSISVFLNTTASGASTPAFAAQQTFVVGSFYTRGIDAADFNGDGLIDVVVTHDDSSPSPAVAVLINTTAPGAPAATFAPPQDFPAGVSPWSVTVADLEGDGMPDIVVNELNPPQLWVLSNATTPGAASVSFSASPPIPIGTTPRAVAIADLDGDGRRDLIIANDGDNTVGILRNVTPAGATTAAFAAQQTFGVPPHPVDLVATDFNGDGRIDIAVADFTTFDATLLLNDTAPAGQFTFDVRPPIPLAANPSSLAFADINGDGKTDLLATNELGGVLTLINETVLGVAAPAFDDRHAFAVGLDPLYAVAADFNGDGKSDLAVANSNDATISVLANATQAGATVPAYATQQTFATDQEPLQLVAPDINGDGKADIVSANFFGSISVLLNATASGAAPAFLPQQSFPTILGSDAVSVTVADFNRDGKPDLGIADNGLFHATVLLNTTSAGASVASFATAQPFSVGWPFFITTADLNLDGAPDMIVANLPNDTVSLMLNTTAPGDATLAFLAAQDYAVGSAPRSVAIADVNGDGKPDLLVADRDDGMLLPLLNITAPGATSVVLLAGAPVPAGANTYAERAIDMNGDGKPDIIASDQTGATATLLTNTTTTGSSSPTFDALAVNTGPWPYSNTTTDVDGDGRPDLVAVNSSDNTVSVLLNAQYRASMTDGSAVGTILSDVIFADGFD